MLFRQLKRMLGDSRTNISIRKGPRGVPEGLLVEVG